MAFVKEFVNKKLDERSARKLEEKRSDLQARIAKLDQRIASKTRLIDDPDYVPSSAEQVQEAKYRAAADAMAGYDADKAKGWYDKADSYRTNLENARLKEKQVAADSGRSQAYKIQSAINSASNLQRSYVDAQQFGQAEQVGKIVEAFKKEMQNERPDILNAYRAANAPADLQKEIDQGTGEAPVASETPESETKSETKAPFDYDTFIKGEIKELWENKPPQNKNGSLKSPSTVSKGILSKINAAGANPETYRKAVKGEIDTLDRELARGVTSQQEVGEYNIKIEEKRKNIDQKDYENYLANRYPTAKEERSAYTKAVNKLKAAVAQATKGANTKGGAYIAMKGVLGDAISAGDFAGLAGFDEGAGLVSQIKTMLGANPMSNEAADQWLSSAIGGMNSIINDYNNQFDESDKYGEKAAKAFRINPVAYKGLGGSGSNKPKNVVNTGKAPKPVKEAGETFTEYKARLDKWKAGG